MPLGGGCDRDEDKRYANIAMFADGKKRLHNLPTIILSRDIQKTFLGIKSEQLF